jgi:cob(I)alamin adenosyltransferase
MGRKEILGDSQKTRSAKEQGLLIAYTGDGKGKTTAALGMIFRAMGYSHKVGVVQFIKGKWKTGERRFASSFSQIDFLTLGHGFTWESEDLQIDKKMAQAAWAKSKQLIESNQYFLLVLDEITYTFQHGFLSLDEVVQTLKLRPFQLTVVLTGRNMPDALIEMADLVTEMKLIKHPFDHGMPAKPGVDF